MCYAWAEPYPDLHSACTRFDLREIRNPTEFAYRPLQGLLQEGPQCGLVALAIALDSPSRDTVDRLLGDARRLAYSRSGEMFSARNMHQLAELHADRRKVELHEGTLDTQPVREFLLDGGLMLVPYDTDKNHAPCEMGGHKAHWAVVLGIVVTADATYALAKHGKSRNVQVWLLGELSRSNAQLERCAPDRRESGREYEMPADGDLSGADGLKCKAVLIYPQ